MRIRRLSAFAVPEVDPKTTATPPGNIAGWEDDGGMIVDPDTTALPPDKILRWEDDGGTVVEVLEPRLDRHDLLAKGSRRG